MLENASSAYQGPALLSMVFVYGVIHAPLLWLWVVSMLHIVANIWRWAAARRTQEQQTSDLSPGWAVVTGKVRLLQGRDAAIRVEIDQRGAERQDKGRVSYSWKEYQRRITANPFDIELAGGALLRCEPTEEVSLVDELDQEKRHDREHRTLAAELTPDERVWAVGQLVERSGRPEEVSADRYRSLSQVGYTLVAPSGGELLVASEPLTSRYRRRVRYYLKWWALTLLCLGALHGVAFVGYHMLQAKGVVVAATITGKRLFRDRNARHWLYLRLPQDATGALPAQLREDASKSTYRRARKGQRVKLLIVPGHPWSRRLGSKPTISWFRIVLLTIGSLVLTGAFVVYRERSRDWWARDLVTHHGKGPLSAS